MQFTTSITVASLLAFANALPAPPVQAVPAFPSEAEADASKLNWIHVAVEANPKPGQELNKYILNGYLIVPLNRLVYMYRGPGADAGNKTLEAVSVKEINYADGSGKPPVGNVVECRVFVDAFGLVQYGQAFSDAGGGSFPYILDDVKGVDVSSILCSDKGARAKIGDETTGNTNTTGPACSKKL